MSASPETSRVWLITGSSRGLGRGFAEAVLAAGHRLVATARKPEQLASLVERYGDRVRAVALDVTNPEQARAAVRVAVEAFGRLDVVVNNAGYGSLAPIEQVTDEDFRSQLDTNLFGVMNVTRAALPVLREQRSGHVIQVSSIGGRLSTPGLGAYQAAKWAVGGFSEVLAKETAPFGVKVTVLEPGGFRTDWAGASMTIPDFLPEYAPTVGVVAQHMRARTGKEPGDPDRAARVLLQVAAMASPPLHLVLGSDAFELSQEKLDALKAQDQKWKDLSLSTDFPEARGPAPRL
ncbi:SDR family NAD(P)-dependent oxidoreductase [Corallococcus macrosporus]|uniref:SDR family NAD(P)-dependent oxidoreductase n=1 Tax=Corallococcus macrosporus TaxID=35 RepID=A0ABS3DQ42_9BACT|nr:oxidoreductase [Corallococcus macrosporus]MBN8233446.1 SDR family NAD(P)-dependent oxidoreductase [Corallococcus macrosporus]